MTGADGLRSPDPAGHSRARQRLLLPNWGKPAGNRNSRRRTLLSGGHSRGPGLGLGWAAPGRRSGITSASASPPPPPSRATFDGSPENAVWPRPDRHGNGCPEEGAELEAEAAGGRASPSGRVSEAPRGTGRRRPKSGDSGRGRTSDRVDAWIAQGRGEIGRPAGAAANSVLSGRAESRPRPAVPGRGLSQSARSPR